VGVIKAGVKMILPPERRGWCNRKQPEKGR